MRPRRNRLERSQGARRAGPKSHAIREKRGGRQAGKSPAAANASGQGEARLVRIEKPIYGGAFLARLDGKALFVPLALPGEEARVRVVDEKRGYATAEIDETVTAAPERVAAPCPYFGACGGCQYQHANYQAQLRYKLEILRETLERSGVRAPEHVDMLSGEPWAYRNRIRLAFDAHGNPGYRGRASHEVIPIAECPIAAPALVNAALAAAEHFKNFAPRARPAELSLFCNAAEESILATVIAGEGARSADYLADYLDGLVAIPGVRGAELVEHRSDRQPRRLGQTGAKFLHYRAAGFDYRVDRGAFFQVNRRLLDALAERVAAGRSGAAAWDLFAGVGLFARRLTQGFERVIAVESAPAATDALEENLRGTGGSAVRSSTLEFLRRAGRSRQAGDAGSIAPDLIVVDPPRTGLGAETTAEFGRIAAPRLVYVSCDPATLARDLRALIAAGYRIERTTVADLFPQTFHLETVVDLSR